jgi:hypothetical protein
VYPSRRFINIINQLRLLAGNDLTLYRMPFFLARNLFLFF